MNFNPINQKNNSQNEIDSHVSDLNNHQQNNNSSFIPKRPILQEQDEKQDILINQETSPADGIEIQAIRTYKGDVNSTVNKDKITTAKVLMAEQRKKDTQQFKVDNHSIQNPKNQFKVLLTLILISATAMAIIFVVYQFLIPQVVSRNEFVFEETKDLIVIDKKTTFETNDLSNSDIKNEIDTFFKNDNGENVLSEIILYKTQNIEGVETTKKIGLFELFNYLEIELPNTLFRSLSDQYVLGEYSNNPFILIKLSNFSNAYNSMFQYETNLVRDFSNVFEGFEEYEELKKLLETNVEIIETVEQQTREDGLNSQSEEDELSEDENFESEIGPEIIEVGEEEVVDISEENTENTENLKEITEEQTAAENIQLEIERLRNKISEYQKFIDLVLENSDSRVLLGENNEILIFYTLIDREWLFISNNKEVLKEVKRRIREKNLIR